MVLLADRRERLADPAHADTAEAQIILGQTLLAAGHPIAARRYLEEAAATRRGRFLATSYRVQEDVIWLAKAALVVGQPRTVLDLLDGQAAETSWFRDQVSFRLGYTARRLHALASGELGRAEEASAGLLAARDELGDWPLDAGLDPLAADFDRSLAELALRQGEAAAAADTLTRLADAEAGAGAGGTGEGEYAGRPPLPAHGWTLVLLARAAARLGDAQRAAECFRAVTDLAVAGVDPCHPVILTARCDEAERRTAVGDTRQAAKLLAPVLDRTLLGHGRPALGEAHPALTRARALAERLGISVPYTLPGLGEASLDIDA
jgi:tetratricopeptide (TPR) repeat protein